MLCCFSWGGSGVAAISLERNGLPASCYEEEEEEARLGMPGKPRSTQCAAHDRATPVAPVTSENDKCFKKLPATSAATAASLDAAKQAKPTATAEHGMHRGARHKLYKQTTDRNKAIPDCCGRLSGPVA